MGGKLAVRHFTFPRIWPARAVGSRTLPVTLQPTAPDTVPNLGVPRGGFVNVMPNSAAVIDGEGSAAGRGFPTPDGYIAAIAKTRGFSVASRDTAPFEAAGVDVINPWRE